MEETIHFGRVAGIRVGANWSLLVIAWLITWGLAGEALPVLVPGYGTLEYWIAGVITAVLFFASLLTHEMGHAIVARHYGVDVKQITLWLFGGVAKLESDTTSAAVELRVGAVGPVVSFGLAVLYGALAVAFDQVSWFALAAGSLWWLCSINLLLAVFNMLPAFPLDGGRVFRAFLWARHGDRVRATVTASRAGQFFGYGLIGLGLLLFASGGGISGLWFVFLGWFLTAAAKMELYAVTQQDLLGGLRVAQVMSSHPVVAPAQLSVAGLIDDYLFRYRHSAYPVVDPSGHPVGLVTLDRLRTVPPDRRTTTSLAEIAFPLDTLVVVDPDTPVTDLVPKLAVSRAGRALVVASGDLVGIVSHTDLSRALDLRSVWRPVAG